MAISESGRDRHGERQAAADFDSAKPAEALVTSELVLEQTGHLGCFA
jgi:hypothetical protein